SAEYERYSEDLFHLRKRCTRTHLFIIRLHRLDEGGLFTYHYTRIRMSGNKLQVIFVIDWYLIKRQRYRSSNTEMYAHSSVKFYNADEFPLSSFPFICSFPSNL
ncbi:hypothetical protein PENTCL1PPCAC_26419, partial [Pristionchus entomophagus]